MASITTIKQLIETFKSAEKKEQASVLKSINIPFSAFGQFLSTKEDGYTRNCIYRCNEFEMILLCWSANCKSPIHGHGGQDCWVYQLKGGLLEKRYSENEDGSLDLSNKMLLKEGSLTYMNDDMGYHSIENNSNETSFSLHVYATPIDECLVFCDEKTVFETVELSYDTT